MGSPFIASLPQVLYSIAPDGLYVNLFAPSTIGWPQGAQRVGLTVATDFPFKPQVAMKVATPAPVAMTLRLRVPGWATREMDVRVNGAPAARGTPGSYVALDRTWKDGDTVDFVLPMPLHTRRYTGQEMDPTHDRHALLYGPALMALVGATDLDIPAAQLPDRLKPIEGKPLHFAVDGKAGVHYQPYWQIDQEPFTCFPTLR
jgi:DUF1680 family protein